MTMTHTLRSLTHWVRDKVRPLPSDRKLLDEFSFALDRVERRVPMLGAYSRIEPYVLECRQAGLSFRFLVYHAESRNWFDNDNRSDGVLQMAAECNLVAAGQTVFDLGSNSGFLTIWFAKKVGPTGRVLAFDPFPWNTLATSYSARLNRCHNVRCLTVGIADGQRTVQIPFRDAKIYENPAARIQDTFPAKLVPLDRFASYRPDFIKVDIEGAERDLLRGALKVVTRKPPPIWYIEVHHAFLRNAGTDPDQLARDFQALGYACHIHHPRGPSFASLGTLPEGCGMFAIARDESVEKSSRGGIVT
jgi:FkbM family methyltransferase